MRDAGGHALIGGINYGQGSSREHAALCPQFLGLRTVLAKSFARIHEQNLVAAGVLPLRFSQPEDYDALEAGDILEVSGIHDAVTTGRVLTVRVQNKQLEIEAHFELSERQREIFLAGGLINWFRARGETNLVYKVDSAAIFRCDHYAISEPNYSRIYS